jgi:hypothetical protein
VLLKFLCWWKGGEADNGKLHNHNTFFPPC